MLLVCPSMEEVFRDPPTLRNVPSPGHHHSPLLWRSSSLGLRGPDWKGPLDFAENGKGAYRQAMAASSPAAPGLRGKEGRGWGAHRQHPDPACPSTMPRVPAQLHTLARAQGSQVPQDQLFLNLATNLQVAEDLDPCSSCLFTFGPAESQ